MPPQPFPSLLGEFSRSPHCLTVIPSPNSLSRCFYERMLYTLYGFFGLCSPPLLLLPLSHPRPLVPFLFLTSQPPSTLTHIYVGVVTRLHPTEFREDQLQECRRLPSVCATQENASTAAAADWASPVQVATAAGSCGAAEGRVAQPAPPAAVCCFCSVP